MVKTVNHLNQEIIISLQILKRFLKFIIVTMLSWVITEDRHGLHMRSGPHVEAAPEVSPD